MSESSQLSGAKNSLRPLGGSIPPNVVKYYAAIDIEALMSDRSFLEKMTRAILKSHRRMVKILGWVL